MHDLAKVSRIESIRPIEGKDRIEMAKVENYNTIIAKGEYSVGDTIVYVFYDAILPADNPDFEFLRARCYSSKYDGYRIKPMKMGGEISEGLVLPLSVLPKGKEYKLGDIVTDDLRIRRYEIFERIPSEVVGGYPPGISKSDEDNIEKVICYYPKWKDIEFYVTEKVEGSAATWIYEKENDAFRTFSHNWEVGDTGLWYDAAIKNNLKEKMALYCLNHNINTLVLQGEVIGPLVQKNVYNSSKNDLYIYGMMSIDGQRSSFNELKDACLEMNIKMVPIISESRFMSDSIDTLLAEADGKSVIYNVPREGLVWRATSRDIDVHFKVKSRPYKIWFEKKSVLWL